MFSAAAVCATALLAGTFVIAEDKAAPPKMDEAAMQKAWMDYATPGEQHKSMATRAGTWEATIEDFSSGQAMVSKGTLKRTMIFDGKYMQEDFESNFMGMPFKGHGMLGFDNNSQEFFYFWIDNMGTGYSRSSGKPNGNKTEMIGEMTSPFGMVKTRIMIDIVDDNTDTMEMFSDMGMGGEEKRFMKITYTRSK